MISTHLNIPAARSLISPNPGILRSNNPDATPEKYNPLVSFYIAILEGDRDKHEFIALVPITGIHQYYPSLPNHANNINKSQHTLLHR